MYEFGIPRVKTLISVESFGNQMNRNLFGLGYALDGEWLYGCEGVNYLVKRQLANNLESETIFSTAGDWQPSNFTTYDDRIYFSIEDYRAGGDVDLYRIREDGSGKRKLLNGGVIPTTMNWPKRRLYIWNISVIIFTRVL